MSEVTFAARVGAIAVLLKHGSAALLEVAQNGLDETYQAGDREVTGQECLDMIAADLQAIKVQLEDRGVASKLSDDDLKQGYDRIGAYLDACEAEMEAAYETQRH